VVSAPLRWDEIANANPKDFTIATMPARYIEVGDLHADIDDHPYSLDQLLEWADRDERDHKAVPDGDGMGPPETE
jgi:DNA primase